MTKKLEKRLIEVREKIADACLRKGRAIESVRLLAVTKRVPAEVVADAIRLGEHFLGESYVQEADAKRKKIAEILGDPLVKWHMIGHLQSNKARMAIQTFDVIETVASVALAEEMQKRLVKVGKKMPCYVQVNIGSDPAKSGVDASFQAIKGLIASLSAFDHLIFSGIMTITPYSEDRTELRKWYRGMADVRKRLEDEGIVCPELSMGMSHDFEIAIEEGASEVRVGTAIFGERN